MIIFSFVLFLFGLGGRKDEEPAGGNHSGRWFAFSGLFWLNWGLFPYLFYYVYILSIGFSAYHVIVVMCVDVVWVTMFMIFWISDVVCCYFVNYFVPWFNYFLMIDGWILCLVLATSDYVIHYWKCEYFELYTLFVGNGPANVLLFNISERNLWCN